MKQPFYQSPLCGDTPYGVKVGEYSKFDPHRHSEIEQIYVQNSLRQKFHKRCGIKPIKDRRAIK